MGLLGIMQRLSSSSTIGDILGELVMFIAPLWIAVIFGVLVGWAWKPKWANLSAIEPWPRDTNKTNTITWCSNLFKFRFPWVPNSNDSTFSYSTSTTTSSSSSSSSSQVEKDTSPLVTEQDLLHLCKLVEEKDGGPAWVQMMDRSTPTMSYQAWRRDTESGPPQYRSRTVFEDASPELVRDFFWDDDFRLKWDDMLIYASTLRECNVTGTMLVHWVRKFPFFCSDREYVIGRRIWDSGQAYYCVTKGVPCPSMPRHSKPKRVDLYYSSWCIRAGNRQF